MFVDLPSAHLKFIVSSYTGSTVGLSAQSYFLFIQAAMRRYQPPKTDFEIVLDQSAYRRAIRELLLHPDGVQVGRIRRRSLRDRQELLIDAWQFSSQIPNAAKLPPLHDYALLVLDAEPESRIHRLVVESGAERSQTLVAIARTTSASDTLHFIIRDRNQSLLPSGVRFIGDGVLVVERESGNDDAASEIVHAPEDHSRVREAIGEDIGSKINAMRCAVLGAGGGASEFTRQLTVYGPASIVCVDDDITLPHNLPLMPHATKLDALKKRPKVDVLVESLHHRQRIVGLRHRITDPDCLRYFEQNRFDTIFAFVDNDAARMATWMVAQAMHAVYIDLATQITWLPPVNLMDRPRKLKQADVRLFLPGPRGGCPACIPPHENADQLWYEVGIPKGGMRPGPRRAWNELRSGSSIYLNSMAIALAIDLWLSFLKRQVTGSQWIRMFWYEPNELAPHQEGPAGDVNPKASVSGMPEITITPVRGEANCRFCNGTQR